MFLPSILRTFLSVHDQQINKLSQLIDLCSNLAPGHASAPSVPLANGLQNAIGSAYEINFMVFSYSFFPWFLKENRNRIITAFRTTSSVVFYIWLKKATPSS